MLEHAKGLERHSRHSVHAVDPSHSRHHDFHLARHVVVIHSTVLIDDEHEFPASLRDEIAGSSSLKILYVRDRFDRLESLFDTIRFLGINVVFTRIPPAQAETFWSSRLPGVQFKHWLGGCLSEHVSRPYQLVSQRPIDLGYQGQNAAVWNGALAIENASIGSQFAHRAPLDRITYDISDSGKRTADWLTQSNQLSQWKATLGTESAASIVDFDGSVERAVALYLKEHPEASSDDIARDCLNHREGTPFSYLSLAQLEAISAGTALILFPGEYSGILVPKVNYLSLQRDFSNIDEVIAALRHPSQLLQGMVRRNDHTFLDSGHYSGRAAAKTLDAVIAQN